MYSASPKELDVEKDVKETACFFNLENGTDPPPEPPPPQPPPPPPPPPKENGFEFVVIGERAAYISGTPCPQVSL